MSSQHRPVDPNRRKALKALGLVSAASVAYPLVAGNAAKLHAVAAENTPAALVHAQRPLRVGLLLAGHAGSSSPAARFKDGMNLYFTSERNREGDGRFELSVEYAGNGVNKAIGLSRRIAAAAEADLVVGFMGSRVTRWLHGMFEQACIPFIEANAGERVSDVNGSSPYLFHNSLGMWQAADAAGEWAAHTLGKACVIVTSFAESGYDTLPAFRNAFEGNGGVIVATHILDNPLHGTTPEGIARKIRESGTDFIYLASSSSDAARVVCALEESGVPASVPMVTSSPDVVLPRAGRHVSVASWYPGLPTRENREFTAAHRAAYGVEADSFALLGYDTARVIAEAYRSAIAGDRNILRTLRSTGFISPRGPLALDGATHAVRTPLYLRDTSNVDSSLRHDMTATLTEIRADHPAVQAIPQAHGWLTTYACA